MSVDPIMAITAAVFFVTVKLHARGVGHAVKR